jgi:putative transposase
MPNNRRMRVPGGTYFFTIALLDRHSDLLVSEVAILREAVRIVRTKRTFHIDAWVVLPDHMHCVWTLHDGDTDYSGRIRDIKRAFSRALPRAGDRSRGRTARGERGIWQDRFWEHTIRNEQDYAAHMDYTHFNPVKHGLVGNASDWPYSSYRRCVARGMYALDWTGPRDTLEDVGERPDDIGNE